MQMQASTTINSRVHRDFSFTGHNLHNETDAIEQVTHGEAPSFASSLEGVDAGLATAEPPPDAPPSSFSFNFWALPKCSCARAREQTTDKSASVQQRACLEQGSVFGGAETNGQQLCLGHTLCRQVNTNERSQGGARRLSTHQRSPARHN